MSDDVMVQPVRTFLEGAELKHPESEPYPVSRSRMLELRANGLVEHVEAETVAAAPEGSEPETPAAPASPPPAVPVAPRRRGRPPTVR